MNQQKTSSAFNDLINCLISLIYLKKARPPYAASSAQNFSSNTAESVLQHISINEPAGSIQTSNNTRTSSVILSFTASLVVSLTNK
jgi:hypothetical protein